MDPPSDGASEPTATGRTGGWSLSARLTAAMLVAALVPLILVSVVIYQDRSDQLRDDALAELAAIANLQEARVEGFLTASRTTLALVASRTQLRRELASLATGDTTALSNAQRIIDDALASVDGLRRISLATTAGTVVVSTSPSAVGGRTLEVAPEAAPGEVVTQVQRVDDGAVLLLATPAFLDGERVGTVQIALDLAPLLVLTVDPDAGGETGETIIAQRSGRDLVEFIVPLRFDPDAQLQRSISSDQVEIPIVTAMRGDEVLLADAIDYRGSAVFAATRYVPEADWGLVVKVDQAEALAPVAQLRGTLVFALVLATVVAVGLALVAARSQTRPLTELTAVVRRAEEGALDARADTTAPGEIGALAVAFNRMADAVAASQRGLEGQVAARTAELQRAVEELERRNRELDAFSSVAAHDLRSPLSVVMGVVEALRAGLTEDPEEQRRLLDGAARACERMNELIGDLLDLARSTTAELTPEAVDLNAVASQVVDALGLEDRVEIGTLPTVAGDERLLAQALQNLISNATSYVADGVTPQVRVAAHREGSAWIVTVDDNGVGIPEDERDEVFQPFARGRATRHREGTGVGLAIVARVVERHDGGVAIATSPLGGTRMLLTLPDGSEVARTG